MPPGDGYPATRVQDRPDGPVVAGQRIELRGLGIVSEVADAFVFDTDSATGPITLRGQLDGPGAVGFREGATDPPRAEIELGLNTRLGGNRWPPHWPVLVSVPSPGC